MFEPNAIVLYVDNPAISSTFYQDLLKIKPIEASSAFHSFTLSNGMSLGLKAIQTVIPSTNNKGSGELAFTVNTHRRVDELFTEWQMKGINIAQSPTLLTYGYTFLALDPDGNRLRVVSLGES
ncbi:VOC family protein [Legionella quateirensis]|uniref:Bleomycin resistance protein n=1 Tax=Legionella quateirensis TaxID=45072 RepID=A0A378KWL1_9GAMM|nr:VOC family protein [Legionella quateirensis]KTD46259.1 bleomycin resistance protein [Legionella quateirensis]STY18972.1 bleomycin resistance protein [Legionella quateirensis]